MSMPVPVEMSTLNVRSDVKQGGVPSALSPTAVTGDDIAVSFRDLTFTVQTKNGPLKLLDNLAGFVKRGTTLTVMGPSGAGKSTFLDCITGKADPELVSGTVTCCGRVVYVPQEDLLPGVLTVRESLRFASRFTNAGISGGERERDVEETARMLGLHDCIDTKIGNVFFRGISGGQKRRVSLGVELMRRPEILVLDEVTSGLDATSAAKMVDLLKGIAVKYDCCVIMTMHQPSSYIFRQLDKLLLLSKGRCVYFGNASYAARVYEASSVAELRRRQIALQRNEDPGFNDPLQVLKLPADTNPADFLLDEINTDFDQLIEAEEVGDGKEGGDVEKVRYLKKANVQMLTQSFQQYGVPEILPKCIAHEQRAQQHGVRKRAEPAHFFPRLLTLLHRDMYNNLRNPAVYGIRMVMYALLAVCLGTVYYDLPCEEKYIQDRVSQLFFVCAFLTFMSVASLPAFLEDRAIFVKERFNGHYCSITYALSKSLGSLPFLFAISLATAGILFPLVGLRTEDGSFWVYTLSLFLALYVTESMFLFVTGVVPEFMVDLAICSGIMGMFMLVCGFFKLLGNLPAVWFGLSHIAMHRYYMEILMNIEFTGRVFDLENPVLINGNQVNSTTGESVLAKFEMDDVDVGVNILILFAMAFCWQILYFIALKWRS